MDVLLFSRLTIGLLFAHAVYQKIRDKRSFEEAVTDLELASPRLSRPITLTVFAAESGCTVLLVSGNGTLVAIGFSLALLVLALFTTVLVVVIRRGTGVTCNCFGQGSGPLSYYDVLRNALAIVFAAVGLILLLVGIEDTSVPVIRVALGGLMAVAFVAIATNLGDVIETLRSPVVAVDV